MAHIKDYQTFRLFKIGSQSLASHTFVPVHMCFGVEFELRRKS